MLTTMSKKELDLIPVLQQLCDKRLTQLLAASLLNLSIRQVQHLLRRYQIDGIAGLSPRKRGIPANNRVFDDLRLKILTLLREKYNDFGPALAVEKRLEPHDLR